MNRKKYGRYSEYLSSVDWLVLKSKLVNRYLKRKLKICCIVCDGTSNLNVHHWDYASLYSKDEIESLGFMCRDCHKKWHFEKGFQENWYHEMISAFNHG